MSNLTVQQQQNMQLIKKTLTSASVQKRIEEMIGRKSDSFITSVLQVIASNGLLAQSTPESVIGSVYTACALNLPLNNNLGLAYLVPFKGSVQLQVGYKGFIQLAQRTGQIKRISVVAVYDVDEDEDVRKRLTSLIPKNPTGNIIGYTAFLETITGFEAIHVMTIEELKSHAMRYSQTYKKGFGVWKDNFDAMARKTVLKLLISKYAPMSVELQTAIESDQGVIGDNGSISYPDNEIKDVTPHARQINSDEFARMEQAVKDKRLKKSDALNESVYALTEEQYEAISAIEV